MKVLHVIPSLAAAHGGPSRAIQLMERALAGTSVQMEVATTDDDGPGRRLQASSAGQGGARNDASTGGVRHFFAKRTEFYKISPALAAWLARHAGDFDLIHIHALFSFSSLAAAWAARRAKVPYVIRPLGTLTNYGVIQRRPFLKRWSLKWLEGPMLRHAEAVHFTAASEQSEAEQLGIPMRGVVLPLAVDTEPVPSNSDALLNICPALEGSFCVLYLGRLDPVKNLEGFVAAVALLAPMHPNVMWLVAGSGASRYLDRLRAQAQEAGVGERIIWLGHVDGVLKAAVLHHAGLFVLPSFSENFGIAAAEALQAGLPCVLGRGVAIAAQVEAAGAGIAVEPEVTAIAGAMAVYLHDPARREQAAKAARVFARRELSLAAMGARLEALYRDIIKNKARQHG